MEEDTVDFASVNPIDPQFYWDNYINYPDGTRRLVAYRWGLDDRDWSPEIKIEDRHPYTDSHGIIVDNDDEATDRWEPPTDLGIWLPTEQDFQQQAFNLVLSLCSDGFHRPLLDIDYPYRHLTWRRMKFGSGCDWLQTYIAINGENREFRIPLAAVGETGILKSSSGNTHAILAQRCTFEKYSDLLGKVPGADAAKFAHVTRTMGFGSLRMPWCHKPGAPKRPDSQHWIEEMSYEFHELADGTRIPIKTGPYSYG